MSELKITIVTAVYNGEKYIEECIKSIMNQTYQNFEHIIMDGGSTDNTSLKRQALEKASPVNQQIQYPAWTDDDDLMSWLNSFGK